MRNLAKWSTWIALALLPVVFLLVGRRWELVFLVGITAVPLFLALAAFHWHGSQGFRWAALALNLLVAAVAIPAFAYMVMNVSAPPSVWAAAPIVAVAHVLALAPSLNVIAFLRRQVAGALPTAQAGDQGESAAA